MKEQEWTESSDPRKLIPFLLRRRVSSRKLKLFACACARQVWELLTDVRCREAVEAVEAALDERITVSQFVLARSRVRRVAAKFRGGVLTAQEVFACEAAIAVVKCYARTAAEQASGSALRARSHVEGQVVDWTPHEPTQREQVAFLRCVFGNPFQPVNFSPEWRTSTVTAIAAEAYASRDFSSLPILADALEEAGCQQQAVLSHCREPGEHVRGCWVVDGLLGKE